MTDQTAPQPRPITPADVRWRLLVSAAEDFEPMFHALWEFGIPASPRPGGPSLDDVKTALWHLIQEGLVTLFHGVDPNGDFIPVPAEWVAAVYADPRSWAELEDPATDVRYSTTQAGDQAVRTRPPDVPEPDWS